LQQFDKFDQAKLRMVRSYVFMCLLVTVVGCASQNARSHSVAAKSVNAQPAKLLPRPIVTIRVEIWNDRLYGSPMHPITYDALKKRRAAGMLFGKDFIIEATDRNLNPFEFLRRHLSDNEKQMLHIWVFEACRPTSDGSSYLRYRKGNYWSLQMKDLSDGGLLLCAPVY
jgi:hypothetical protein